MNLFSNKKGFSLVEMLIYIAILVLMLFVIVNILQTMVSSQRTLKTSKALENSGIFSLERMVREIRNAENVNTLQSALGNNPGVLVLSGTDEDGNPRTVKFLISGGLLTVEENGVSEGALTQVGTNITSLIFNHIITDNSEAVRIQMTVESGTGSNYRSENFYSTAVLRDSL